MCATCWATAATAATGATGVRVWAASHRPDWLTESRLRALTVALLSYCILLALGTRLMLYGHRRFAIALIAGLTLSVGAQWLVPNPAT